MQWINYIWVLEDRPGARGVEGSNLSPYPHSSNHNTEAQTRAAGMIRNQKEKYSFQMCKSIILRV